MIDATGNIIITIGNSFLFATSDGSGNAYVNTVSENNAASYGLPVNGIRRSPDGQYYAMWVNSSERGNGVGVMLINELHREVSNIGGSFIFVTSAEESIGFYRGLKNYGYCVEERFEKGKTRFIITRD